MKPFYYIVLFLGSSIGFIVYNEVIVLPYQVWDPSGFISREEMALRNPLINLGIVLGSYILICVGSYSYVSYYEKLEVMDLKRSLTDLPTLKGTTKKGKWLK